MARPVKVREKYTTDRTRLCRLEEAVERDERLPDELRGKLREQLQNLTALFVEADRLRD